MNKKLIVATLALPLMLGVASAYAFDGKGHGKWGDSERGRDGRGACGGGFDAGLMHKLDLSDDQKQQLKELRVANKESMKKRFEQNFDTQAEARKAQRGKMQQLVLADKFDKAAAKNLAQDVANNKVDFMVQKMERQHEMMSILTGDQKAEFVELQQKRQQDCQDRMARHGRKNDF